MAGSEENKKVYLMNKKKVFYKVDNEWITSLLEEKSMSLRALAGKIKMDPGSLSMACHGTRSLKAFEAMRLAKHLAVNISVIHEKFGLMEDGDEVEKESVPVIGKIDSKGGVYFAKYDPVEKPDTVPVDTVVLTGPSPNAHKNAELVACFKEYLYFFEQKNSVEDFGVMSYVETQDRRQLIATVFPNEEKEGYSLATPDGVEEGVAIRSVSPFLWMRPA
jgi:transcriptional regulator with XRE-family HTH domain